MFISINPDQPEIWYLLDAIHILEEGGVVACPTDTMYGLVCDVFNKEAIERIYQIKNMPKKKQLSFICSDLKHIAEYARVSNTAYRLMKRLVPGPYTFILPATHSVPRLLLDKKRTVGIRVPDNKICHEIVNNIGHPILSSTIKVEENEPSSDPFKIYEAYGNQLDAVIDGGPMKAEVSTVIDLTGQEPVIIREGKGDISDLV